MTASRGDCISAVEKIMAGFADRTGLSDARRPPRRYLWTDAHAVCNFLSLYRRTGREEHRQLATALIDQVHSVLGRHRDDDPRSGWISGFDEKKGRAHPTAGGLRIGKNLNERAPDAPLDERLEWDRDGQYFHYLTKWMHALRRASVVTGEPRYCRWAVELAKAAYEGFAVPYTPGGRQRLIWKMSIDLSRPLVPSTGQHDALDGFITFRELGACATDFPDTPRLPGLEAEVAGIATMLEGQRWQSDDPLGIGGLLFDTCRVSQMTAAGHMDNPGLLSELTQVSVQSLDAFAAHMPFGDPPEYRLAFRELGLSIGLRGVAAVCRDVEGLAQYLHLAEEIETFWSQPRHQRADSWLEHRDINSVMLATSLLPDEFVAA